MKSWRARPDRKERTSSIWTTGPKTSQAGLARGWRALLHETPEKTIPALRRLGLPVDLNP